MRGLFRRRQPRQALLCSRDICHEGVHYHWGWGQRHTSLTPVLGEGSFSSGQPYYKPRSTS